MLLVDLLGFALTVPCSVSSRGFPPPVRQGPEGQPKERERERKAQLNSHRVPSCGLLDRLELEKPRASPKHIGCPVATSCMWPPHRLPEGAPVDGFPHSDRVGFNSMLHCTCAQGRRGCVAESCHDSTFLSGELAILPASAASRSLLQAEPKLSGTNSSLIQPPIPRDFGLSAQQVLL